MLIYRIDPNDSRDNDDIDFDYLEDIFDSNDEN
jgi:hypothetical protein